nr:pulmonary surfactant-associated protein D-like [Leptinotarsa decemlineata]
MLTKVLVISCSIFCVIDSALVNQTANDQDSSKDFNEIQLEMANFRTIGDMNYYFHLKSTMTQPEAKKFCNSMGKNLVSIPNERVNVQLYEVFEKEASNKQVYFWSSGERINGNCFYWSATGKAFVFTSWASSEPNNVGGNENCVETYHYPKKGQLLWNDIKCDFQRYVVCENSGVDAASSNETPTN